MHSAKELRHAAWTILRASSETEEPERRRKLIDEAFDLAQRAAVAASQENSSVPEAARLTYRLYLIEGGHFAAARHFDIATDDAALAVARAVYDACSELFQGLRREVTLRGLATAILQFLCQLGQLQHAGRQSQAVTLPFKLEPARHPTRVARARLAHGR
jgi:hypothetical protein